MVHSDNTSGGHLKKMFFLKIFLHRSINPSWRKTNIFTNQRSTQNYARSSILGIKTRVILQTCDEHWNNWTKQMKESLSIREKQVKKCVLMNMVYNLYTMFINTSLIVSSSSDCYLYVLLICQTQQWDGNTVQTMEDVEQMKASLSIPEKQVKKCEKQVESVLMPGHQMAYTRNGCQL